MEQIPSIEMRLIEVGFRIGVDLMIYPIILTPILINTSTIRYRDNNRSIGKTIITYPIIPIFKQIYMIVSNPLQNLKRVY